VIVTVERLKQIAPRARADIARAIVAEWAYAEANGIQGGRVAPFLATLALESQGFTRLEENLTYTTTARLRKVWPARFPTDAAARPYVRNPQALAERVYGKRMGNKAKGDGWRYRGGGLIQLTGRSNYQRFGYADRPEALRQPGPAFRAAVDFWAANDCNRLADADDLRPLRKRINGGLIGMDEFMALVRKARPIFASPAPVADPPEADDEPALGEPVPEDTIRRAQELLRELGYVEVGEPDGRFGKRTRNALNAFKADHGLPLELSLDPRRNLTDEALAALAKGEAREEAPERAEATANDLAPKSQTVARGLRARFVAAIGAAWSFVLAAFWGAVDFFGDAWEKIEPVRYAVASVPIWAWFGLAGAIALGLWWQSNGLVGRVVADYRQGKKL
jgi:predicted chitinase